MATLREAQKTMTKRLLLDGAPGLFETKGYAATTIDDPAVGAGTSRTTFYTHFPSKTVLVADLIIRLGKIPTDHDEPALATTGSACRLLTEQ
ncbi:TetR/AcrR family transcriptional regulator [Arthrobacter sp. KK5.5]|uniref:TetR/AcrR family transcriptional regulator n=1 Tax=Arthrobacter sp. KK5.5 TaxID=3373084 RepID=UPI003EE77802